MLRLDFKESKPVFLWILLIATTIVLGLVIWFFVVQRSGDGNGYRAVTGAEVAAAEQQYKKEVRSHVLAYITKVQKLSETNASDRATWKALATELHATLLNISGVPVRMQTIHLSIVLSVSQVMASLGTDAQPSVAQHVDQLNAIILALG